MSTLDPTLAEILKAVDEAEKERSPATPDLIAEKCGLEVQEIRERLAECRSMGLTYYFNSPEETALPTAPGWTLTPEGQALIESDNIG
jgi:hypothetical protein